MKKALESKLENNELSDDEIIELNKRFLTDTKLIKSIPSNTKYTNSPHYDVKGIIKDIMCYEQGSLSSEKIRTVLRNRAEKLLKIIANDKKITKAQRLETVKLLYDIADSTQLYVNHTEKLSERPAVLKSVAEKIKNGSYFWDEQLRYAKPLLIHSLTQETDTDKSKRLYNLDKKLDKYMANFLI